MVKAPLGALLSTGIGIASSVMEANRQEEAQQEQQRKRRQQQYSAELSQDKLELEQYQTEGAGKVDYYRANGGKIGMQETDPTTPKKKSTAAGRNKLRRKTYLDKVYKMGLDTTNVDIKKGRGTLRTSGSTQRPLGKHNVRPTITANYPNTKGGETRLDYLGDKNRVVSRGYQVEPEKAYGGNMSVAMNTPMRKGRKMAKGGNMGMKMSPSYRTKGGKLMPLSSDMEKAYGNKHYESKIDGTSGIKLNRGGNTVAEIEGGETIKNGTMVYSDRTKVDGKMTYADKAESLARKKAEVELDMKDKDAIGVATSKRKLTMLDNKEDMLFAHQEMMKGKKGAYGMKIKAHGGRIPKPNFSDQPTSHRSGDRFSPYPINSGNRALNDYLSYESPGSSQVELNTPAPKTSEVDKVLKLNKALGLRRGKKGKMMNGGSLVYDSTFAPKFGHKYKKGGVLPMATGGKLQKGGKFKKIVEGVAPLIDNLGNAILTANTPELSTPQLQRVKNLETEVNVNPQLSAVTEAVEGATEGIRTGTSNSAVARSNIASTRLRGSQQKAKILADKENTEKSLRNRNILNRQGVQAANLDKLNRFGERQTAREGDIQGRVSANLANLSGDIVDNINRGKAEEFDKERLDIIKQQYNPGVVRRADLNNPSSVNRMSEDKGSLRRNYGRYKSTKEEQRFLDATGFDPFEDAFGKVGGSKRLVRKLRRTNRNRA
jgi:hypothetical protein